MTPFSVMMPQWRARVTSNKFSTPSPIRRDRTQRMRDFRRRAIFDDDVSALAVDGSR